MFSIEPGFILYKTESGETLYRKNDIKGERHGREKYLAADLPDEALLQDEIPNKVGMKLEKFFNFHNEKYGQSIINNERVFVNLIDDVNQPPFKKGTIIMSQETPPAAHPIVIDMTIGFPGTFSED